MYSANSKQWRLVVALSLGPTVGASEVELQGQRKPPILCWKEMIIYHLVIHRDWVTRLTTGERSEASSESRTEKKNKAKTPSNHVQTTISLHHMNLKIPHKYTTAP